MKHRTEELLESSILIPPDRLSSQALHGLVEEFILREGTDYGLQEVSFSAKKQQIMRALERQDIYVVYSTLTENTTLLTKQEYAQKTKPTSPRIRE